MKHSERFLWLDLVRGLSAVAVCAGHLRAMLFLDYSQLESPTAWDRGFYFATGLGHQAVMVFFVLSGFFVGGAVWRKRDAFAWRSYAISRLSRLWVVLLPALALTYLVDQAIGRVSPGVLTGSHLAIWSSGPTPAEGISHAWNVLAANLFFLQTIAAPVFGSNSPLWSLANEFWYYALFPLSAYASGLIHGGTKPGLVPRVAAGLASAGLLAAMPSGMRLGFLIWCLGFLGFVAVSGRPGRFGRMALPGMAVFLLALAASKSAAFQARFGAAGEAVVGIGFLALCIPLASAREPRVAASAIRWISDISYSLYLIHFPLVLLVGGALYGTGQSAPDLRGHCMYWAWLAALIAAATVFWWCFEKRTESIRSFLIGRRDPRPRTTLAQERNLEKA